MLLQYAREHHFPNPTFFVDDGVSGVTYDRPGFQAMLAEIEAGRVAVAIAKDLSRLGRNSALTGLYTNFTFPQNGVRFIAINDNYDTIDPNRVDNDFAGIKNWFNEFYARDTSRKIRAVQKAKGERGVPLTTNVPYGYVKDLENPRRWVVDPVAADVVKRIFDLCMKGRGPMQIANQLKADKVLRELVNPPNNLKKEVKCGSRVFRVGDRIMQTVNRINVSNGDVGIITDVETEDDDTIARVKLLDGRELSYTQEMLEDLEFSYCTTIHKSQGQEYPVIIVPLLKEHYIMLRRNLLYTAVTRAKAKVILIGQKQAVFIAIHKCDVGQRNTVLADRIVAYYNRELSKRVT